MLTEDYLLRMINLALAALVRIVGLKATGQYREALQEIDQTLGEMFGMRADLIKRLDDRVLLNSLTFHGFLDIERISIVSDIYKEEGDILALQGRTSECYWSYLRSLNLSIEVALNSDASESVAPANSDVISIPLGIKIKTLLQKLEAYNLPQETLYALASYYEQAGDTARAEAILAELKIKPGFP
jgi:hypothetical protein